MGILQGDSPTPGPAMYWQPFQHGDQQRNVAALADAKSPSLMESSGGVSSMLHSELHTSSPFQHPQFDCGQVKEESMTSPEMTSHHAAPLMHDEEKNETPLSSGVYCAGCGQAIADRFYLVAVDRTWHSECLRCSECHSALDTAHSCFARQSRIYCKDDYYRLFGTKQCAKCGLVLAADELVMRARDHFYHTRCFSCHVCGVHLTKGSTFGMLSTLIFCRDHYPGDQSAPADYGARPASPLLHQSPFGRPFHPHPFHPHHYHLPYLPGADYATCGPDVNHFGVGQPQAPPIVQEPGPASSAQSNPQYKNRIRKRRPNKEMPMADRDDDSSSGFLMGDESSTLGAQVAQQPQQQKTKRLRTSFKHHQLRMLKSYFATNHNPDAKDLKQLSQKTTLSKRVLQVWFQNARAKWRRMMQKQEAGAGGSVHEHPAASPSSTYGHQAHHLVDESNLMTSSRSSMYDDLSFSGSSSASVGFPSPM